MDPLVITMRTMTALKSLTTPKGPNVVIMIWQRLLWENAGFAGKWWTAFANKTGFLIPNALKPKLFLDPNNEREYCDTRNNISQKPCLTIVLLYIVLKKITTNAQSHGTLFDVALWNHALRAQPTDYPVFC